MSQQNQIRMNEEDNEDDNEHEHEHENEEDEDEDNEDSDEFLEMKSYKKKPFIISGFLFLILLFTFSSVNNIVKRPVKMEPVYNHLITNQTVQKTQIIKLINWWERFTTICCTLTVIQNKFLDCESDGICSFYLNQWLHSNNRQYLNNSVFEECCYDYRPVGKDYRRYCSLQCLNNVRNINNLVN